MEIKLNSKNFEFSQSILSCKKYRFVTL